MAESTATNPAQTLIEQKSEAIDATKEVALKAPTNFAEIEDTLLEAVKVLWTQTIQHLPLLAIGLIVLLLTGLVSFGVKRSVQAVLRSRNIRHSLIEVVLRMTGIFVWVLGLMVAAMVIFPDVTFTKVFGALGLFSLAIGFAFKDIFENFFAGILMLWKFPFESGDYIECEEINGRIENITVRQTLIRQTNGDLIVVPNGYLFKNPVEIQTQRPKRRIRLMTGVAYSEDVEEAITVITKAAESCETVDKNEPLQVFATEFGESSIDIEVVWWAASARLEQRRSRSEVLIAVKKALDEAGIEIPFPYRTLTFKENLRISSATEENGEDETENVKA